jgi:hypothetical protein
MPLRGGGPAFAKAWKLAPGLRTVVLVAPRSVLTFLSLAMAAALSKLAPGTPSSDTKALYFACPDEGENCKS